MMKAISFALCLAVFGVSACTETSIETPVVEAPTAFESPYFSVTVTGTGPDVILMPGLASSSAVWDSTVAAFEADFTLHAVQVYGFAGAASAGNTGNENVLDDLAAGLATYSSQLETRPVLVGHSLGGLVAMKAALISDSELSQLVIVDVLPFFSVLMDPDATAESIAPVSAIMKAAMLGQSDEVFALRQGEALKALVKSEDDLQQALSWSIASDRAVMAQAMSEVLVTDLRTDIGAIKVPTLVIYAKDDATPNMEAIEAFYQDLYANIPDVSLVAIEDAFHFIMMDQPDAFIAALESALAQ